MWARTADPPAPDHLMPWYTTLLPSLLSVLKGIVRLHLYHREMKDKIRSSSRCFGSAILNCMFLMVVVIYLPIQQASDSDPDT
jgi:hypothetical protein